MDSDSEDSFNIVYSVMQNFKDMVLEQIKQIKMYPSKDSKDIYPDILKIQQQNRESLLILIEIQQLYEKFSFRIPIDKIKSLYKQFQMIDFDKFSYINIKGRVNKRQNLSELIKNDNNDLSTLEKLNTYINIVSAQYCELLKEKDVLENERKQCTERKDKKNLNDKIYRKDLNVQYFKILNDTLFNLKFNHLYFQSVQQQVDITEFIKQQDIDFQTNTSIKHELYIRSSLKEGRRDKKYIKILMFSISLLFAMSQSSKIYPENAFDPEDVDDMTDNLEKPRDSLFSASIDNNTQKGTNDKRNNQKLQGKNPDQSKHQFINQSIFEQSETESNHSSTKYVKKGKSPENQNQQQPFKSVVLSYIRSKYGETDEVKQNIFAQDNQFLDQNILMDQINELDSKTVEEKNVKKKIILSDQQELGYIIQALDKLDDTKGITFKIENSILEQNINKLEDILKKYRKYISKVIDSEWILDKRNKHHQEQIEDTCKNISIVQADDQKQNETMTNMIIKQLKTICEVIQQEKLIMKSQNNEYNG